MDVKIESMIFGWDERIPEALVKFINSVTLKCLPEARSSTASSLSDMEAATFGSSKGRHPTQTSAWRTAY